MGPLSTREDLRPWTWVWLTVDYNGVFNVQLSLWDGNKFLTANGQVPVNGEIKAYQLVEFPKPPEPWEIRQAV